ncbi:alpha/beta hydrolase [Sphaerisporangium sp. NBC_01403]|uniref:alpha/beta fold hydrolase n=1 Tax=Sphaerisporangium sp. NBC_01403 TaxID=2903599 RepID=UPI0032482F74
MNMLTVDPLGDAALAHSLDGDFTSHYADVNDVRLHYVEGGSGRPLLLLGGWPQTWWQWHKVMPALARRHRVIAVDLRGMGGSAKPTGGYDKRTMARDIRELVRHLGLESVGIAGHDIGGMVAQAHAAAYPEATTRIALLDVPHPDESWSDMRLLPEPDQHINTIIENGARSYLWWFAFNQVRGLPEKLLDGRSRLVVDWLFERQAKDPAAIDEQSRQRVLHRGRHPRGQRLVPDVQPRHRRPALARRARPADPRPRRGHEQLCNPARQPVHQGHPRARGRSRRLRSLHP